MTPTICPDKKHQIRPEIRGVRHHARNVNLTNPTSTVLNYAAKGLRSSREMPGNMRDVLIFRNERFKDSPGDIMKGIVRRLEQQSNNTSSTSQDSDDYVSSTTNDNCLALNLSRHTTAPLSPLAISYGTSNSSSSSGSPYQDTEESMNVNAEDEEESQPKHSPASPNMRILRSYYKYDKSSGSCSGSGSSDGDVDVEMVTDADQPAHDEKQLVRCALKTVFNVPNLSDKQQHLKSFNGRKSDISDFCEIQNSEGLLAIALKTIKLVKRNEMLQQRLAQLQLETSEFIQSVLANPENQHFRDKMHQKTEKVESV